jgi:hypothetical protein
MREAQAERKAEEDEYNGGKVQGGRAARSAARRKSRQQPTAAEAAAGAGACGRRLQKGSARGDKKRAKRAVKDMYYLVVDGVTDRGQAFAGRAAGAGAAGGSIMEDAVRVAKKAWSQNKKALLKSIVVEHQRTGTRYTFDPRQWCDANGKTKFAESGQNITAIRVSARASPIKKRANGSTGLTPRLRALEVPSVDMSDSARLLGST